MWHEESVLGQRERILQVPNGTCMLRYEGAGKKYTDEVTHRSIATLRDGEFIDTDAMSFFIRCASSSVSEFLL